MADEQGTSRKSLRGHVTPGRTPSPHVLRTRAARGDTGSGKKKPATNTSSAGASARKAPNIQKDAEGNLIYKRRNSIGTRSSNTGTDKESPAKATPKSRMHGTRLSTGSLKADVSPAAKTEVTSKLRKRSTSHESEASNETVPSSKKRKTGKTTGSGHDTYCWQCHGEVTIATHCELCPRVFHTKCLAMEREPTEDWVCPECEKIMRAECVDTRSESLSMITVDQLCLLLKYALTRMKCAGSEPFHKPVDTSQVTNYSDFVLNPIDLSMLEKNVKKKMYGSTEAFLSDAKWILHNCIIFNGKHHKLTSVAKTIIKIAKHEMNEVEICPDCYFNSCTKRGDNWFCEPCRVPHPLVWAKMRGYPYWPAKALRTVKDQVDCRFFGEHDRAWVHVSSVFLLSEECPVLAKKKTHGFDLSMAELNLHISRIRAKFSSFVFAPVHTTFNASQKSLEQKTKESDGCSVRSENDDNESMPGFMSEDKDVAETGSDIHITGKPRKIPGMGRGAKMNAGRGRKVLRKGGDKTPSIAYRTASALKTKYSRKSIITTRLAKTKAGNATDVATKPVETGSESSEQFAMDDVSDVVEIIDSSTKDEANNEDTLKESAGTVLDEIDVLNQSGINNPSKKDDATVNVISLNDGDDSTTAGESSKLLESDKTDSASDKSIVVQEDPVKTIGPDKIDTVKKDDTDEIDLTQKDEDKKEEDVQPEELPLLKSDPKKNPLLAKIVESCKEKLGISDEEEILEKSKEEEDIEEIELSDDEVSDMESANTSETATLPTTSTKGGDNTVTSTTVGCHVCVYCGKVCSSERMLSGHVKTQHPPIWPIQCMMCRKQFPYRSKAVAHLKRSHKILTEEIDIFLVTIDITNTTNVLSSASSGEKPQEPAGESVTSTQGTSRVCGEQNLRTSPAGERATSVVTIDSDTDTDVSLHDSSQSERLVIDLDKSQDAVVTDPSSRLTLTEPALMSEVRKKRKLTPPKTGKIVKRKSGGAGKYASSALSKAETYKINTGNETLKLSVGQLRMLEAAGKLKNPSWRESQKSAGDKVTPVRPTQSVETTSGDDTSREDPVKRAGLAITVTEEVRSVVIDSTNDSIDPVSYSSTDSDEEVKNYKLNMENSVERLENSRDGEKKGYQASQTPAKSSAKSTHKTKDASERRVSSDKENNADGSETVVSPEEAEKDRVSESPRQPKPKQQEELLSEMSRDVGMVDVPEEITGDVGLVIREVGTLTAIPESSKSAEIMEIPEVSENIKDDFNGVSTQNGTSAEDVQGACLMDVTESEEPAGKTGDISGTMADKRVEVEKPVSSSPDSTETPTKSAKVNMVVHTGAHTEDTDMFHAASSTITAAKAADNTGAHTEDTDKSHAASSTIAAAKAADHTGAHTEDTDKSHAASSTNTTAKAADNTGANAEDPDKSHAASKCSSESVEKDSPGPTPPPPDLDPTLSGVDGNKPSGQLLSGVEMPTFDPVDATDTVFDLNKYTAQMMDSVKEVMSTMARDLLTKQAGQALKSSFTLEIEKLKWKHEQELFEIKHNTAVNLAEVKSSFDKVMKKAITEQQQKLTEEKQAAVTETKKKQWCANCGEEAVFYCCWNTSYCDFPCQKHHWPQHMTLCTQTSGTSQQPTIALGAPQSSVAPPSSVAEQQLMSPHITAGASSQGSSWKDQARDNLSQALNKQNLYSGSTVAPPSQLPANQTLSLPTSLVTSTQFLPQPRATMVQPLGGGVVGSLGAMGFAVSHPPLPQQPRDNPPLPILMMQNRAPPGGMDMISAHLHQQPRTF